MKNFIFKLSVFIVIIQKEVIHFKNDENYVLKCFFIKSSRSNQLPISVEVFSISSIKFLYFSSNSLIINSIYKKEDINISTLRLLK